MTTLAKARWQLHFCVLLWGFTAILGRLISMPAVSLVWWRLLIVVGCLAAFPQVWRAARKTSARLLWIYAGIGVLVAAHWLTFYGAIKLANASVAVTCLALGPAFLSIVEPWVARRAFDWRELALGVAVIPGVALVVGGVPHDMRLGLVIGVISALMVSFFVSYNKRFIDHADPLLVTAVELGAGLIFVTLLLPVLPVEWGGDLSWPVPRDALFLVLLAVGCTLLPFTLSLVALRHLTAFSAQLAVNLEPIYAIVLAALLLGEQRELGPAFYAGVAVVMAAVFLHPLVVRKPELVAPEALAAEETVAGATPEPSSGGESRAA